MVNVLSIILMSIFILVLATIAILIPTFVIWLIGHLVHKNSKIKEYQSVSKILLILGCINLFFLAGMYVKSNNQKKSIDNYSNVADGFTIESYKVKANVSSNNVVDVTEIINVNFFDYGHHGIYKFIPKWLEYTGKDGKTISRKSVIENLEAVGEEYKNDEVNGKKRIRIGSPKKTLDIGLKTYTITYKYNMGSDPFENFDEFIFHFFGDYWGTRIKNASLEIAMPKEIDANSIKFFADKYRKEDITSYVNYYVENNTIFANLYSAYDLNKSLTVDIELPEGYFEKGLISGTEVSFIAFNILIILLMVIAFIMWKKYGKDNKKIETVEFYAPDSYDAASIGYIYKKDSGRKLAIALIVELASKGYIKIDEEDEKKDDNVDYGKKIIVTNQVDINKVEMTSNERIIFDKLFENGNKNVLSDDNSFYKVFDKLTKNLQKELDNIIDDVRSYKKMFFTSILFYMQTIYLTISFTSLDDINLGLKIIYFVSLISVVITFILVLLMKRKSPYGEELMARIKGFKNYMKTAEKDEINDQAEKHPNYFYDILPYAYVLGVSSEWIERFEKIPEPQYDIGDYDFSVSSSIDNLADSILGSSNGDSSGCGGGCSSCGGGCSSCGGGGSW